MNYTETFDQFASRVTTLDLALYAGVGLVLYVLFKDKLGPVQSKITNLLNNYRNKINAGNSVVSPVIETKVSSSEDVFFQLVASWKQTRDLAVKSNCFEAIKVADQMFPYLSPNVCTRKETDTTNTK